ncbi:hypothetical protein RYR28_002719 [Edwardsiella piscicida]|uniref:hypothetical protein n=1 Tax=Edwardsiella piscicida TaxID=1263550 RepID=UPI00290F4920|nr:hypothetical protein [Edwardsiella piscicida]
MTTSSINTQLFSYSPKDNTITCLGQVFTIDYFNRVQVPLLLDALKWSPRLVLSWYTKNNLSVPRIFKLQQAQEEIAEEERQDTIERQRLEEHRRMHFPTDEERKEDELKRQRREQQRKELIKRSVEIASNKRTTRAFPEGSNGICDVDWGR